LSTIANSSATAGSVNSTNSEIFLSAFFM